jgi:hypothetical protein
MSATNFKTENNIFRKLIGNGLTYKIPHFQRDYSWTESEWDDLWQDILGTISEGGEPAHYMGYLVLQSDDEKTFEVIDGQQRLTTLTLIVLAVLKNIQDLVGKGINPEQNQRRIDQIRQSYIGYLDPVTLVSRPKLSLNRNNNDYFQTYLIPLGHLPQRGFKASEHSLRKAFEWFYKRIQDYLKKINGDPGKALAQLVEDISDKLFFTVITVTDELNAYKVFETLNARGVRLSSTDLLKNYLFSVLHKENQHEHELKILDDRWEKMVGRLGSESFPDFLRTHWNSRHAFVRQSELFKTIRKKVNSRDSVFSLLRDMEQDTDTYIALTQPETSEWSNEIKDYVRKLRMFSVRQPFPLILAAARVISDGELETLIRSCVVISFRYNVIGKLQSNEQERVYTTVAQKIFAGEFVSLNQILLSLRPIYIEDDSFFSFFADKSFDTRNSRNTKIVRYILCQLEKQESNQDHDFESNTFNIEHILPQKPDAGWQDFTDAELDTMTFRLGNMALLEKNKNQQAENSSFQIKKPILASSGFKTTQSIAVENESWSSERIEIRQKKMAKLAKTIWRISQLS